MYQDPYITRKRRLSHEINVVPYIDVMLVLLVIFMVTAPLLTPGIAINLPQVAADEMALDTDKDPIELAVLPDGQYLMNIGPEGATRRVTPEQVVNYLLPIMTRNPQETVLLKGDAKAEYALIAKAMVLLQNAGVSNIGFPVENPSDTP